MTLLPTITLDLPNVGGPLDAAWGGLLEAVAAEAERATRATEALLPGAVRR